MGGSTSRGPPEITTPGRLSEEKPIAFDEGTGSRHGSAARSSEGVPSTRYRQPDSLFELLVPFEAIGGLAPVALLSGEWLLERASQIKAKGTDRQSRAKLALPHRQILEHEHPEAFLNVQQVKEMQDTRGYQPRLKVLVVSYAWLTQEHPDPFGDSLQMLAVSLERAQQAANPKLSFPTRFAVFIDWCSLYQRGDSGRSMHEQMAFEYALARMQLWYAHSMTSVCMLIKTPKLWVGLIRPYSDRGWPTFERALAMLVKPSHLLGWKAVNMVGEQYSRAVPLTPAKFAEVLKEKVFTSVRADEELVVKLYAETFAEVIGGAQTLEFDQANGANYNSANWGDAEVVELATQVLPYCRCLQKLDLWYNNIGDDGVAVLAKNGLSTLSSLNLRYNKVGNDGFLAIATALNEGRFPCLRMLRADLNPASQGGSGRTALIEACKIAGVQLWLEASSDAAPTVGQAS